MIIFSAASGNLRLLSSVPGFETHHFVYAATLSRPTLHCRGVWKKQYGRETCWSKNAGRYRVRTPTIKKSIRTFEVMEGRSANGCNVQLSQEPVPIYKALNEPFHATSRSPNSITNQAWLRLSSSPVTGFVGFGYCSWGAFPENHGAGHGKMMETVHFFAKQT